MIQPIRNNVLVKPFMNEEKTEGGLIVPEAFRGESDRVEVIAVGQGTSKRKMTLSVGEIGYRVKGWGEQVIDNGTNYYIMDCSAIIAKQ